MRRSWAVAPPSANSCRYLAGDKKSAIAAVPTKLVEHVALVGPWTKITDEIQRWKQTVLTTFSVNSDPRHPEKIATLIR